MTLAETLRRICTPRLRDFSSFYSCIPSAGSRAGLKKRHSLSLESYFIRAQVLAKNVLVIIGHGFYALSQDIVIGCWSFRNRS